MDLSKTVYAMVGVLVAVLIVATVAVPIIENAEDTESTKYNNPTGGRFLLADNDVSFTASFTADAASVDFNGTTYARTSTINGLLMSDLGVVWFNGTSSNSTTITTSTGSVNYTTETINITVSGKNLTITVDGTRIINGTTKWLVVADPDGTHVSGSKSNAVYVNSIHDLIVYNYSETNGAAWAYDGMTSENTTITPTQITQVDGFVDLFQITGVTLNINGADVLPYNYLVPAEVSAHTQTNATHVALLGAALLMLFLVPLMMVVNMIRGRSD